MSMPVERRPRSRRLHLESSRPDSGSVCARPSARRRAGAARRAGSRAPRARAAASRRRRRWRRGPRGGSLRSSSRRRARARRRRAGRARPSGICVAGDHAGDLDRRRRDHAQVDARGRRACGTSCAATPGCERMPAPMIEILPSVASSSTSHRAERPLGERDRARVAAMSSCGTENDSSATPCTTFWMIVSTLTCLGRDGVEHLGGGARAVRDAGEGEDDLGLGVRHSGDDGLFHDVLRGDDPGALLVRERRAGVHANAVVAGELDRAQHQHLGAGGRHLEHLLVGDAVELAGAGHDARVGGVDARPRRSRSRRRRRARRRARRPSRRCRRGRASSRPCVSSETPWKPATSTILPASSAVDHAVGADVEDLAPCCAPTSVTMPGLRAGERDGLVPEVVDRHRHERAGDALAGREQHVELARVGRGRDLVRRARSASRSSCPWPRRCRRRAARAPWPRRGARATARTFSASATDEPPNFMTTVSNGVLGRDGRRPSPPIVAACGGSPRPAASRLERVAVVHDVGVPEQPAPGARRARRR